MRVLVSGAGGLIGRNLVPALTAGGHQVVRLIRGRRSVPTADVIWSPELGQLDPAGLEGIDGVIHLAGEPILGRWTPARRTRIRDSRVDGTALLARTIAGLKRKPRVLVCASASGYYGDRGDDLLTEESAPGTGFLADVCRAWEAAAAPARAAGLRVVHVRTGLALARGGGLLGTILLPFRLGVGGPIGRGARFWSWIAIDDLVDVFRFALESHSLAGAVNGAAPHPVTNARFARTLGRVLSRPAFIPVPPAALRLVFGRDAADEAMLASARLVPARLLAAGFRFRFPELEGALRHELQQTADSG
jgi:uncharacterized protein (TIGR01777 family)